MSVTIVIEVPPQLVLNANDGADRWVRAPKVKELRTRAAWMKLAQARNARFERARCTCTITFANRSRRRDTHNWMPTVKAIIDGLVSGANPRPKGAGPWPQGLLPDDNSDHLTGPDLREGHDPTLTPGHIRVALTFTEEPTP